VGPKGLLITIDGPAGAGKSTLGRRLAQELGYLFLDTGAMYRAVGLWAKEAQIDPNDKETIEQLCERLDLRLKQGAQGVEVFLNGRNVTPFLRTPEIDRWSSVVAQIPGVRSWLLRLQRSYGLEGGVVAEGRDMGSVVFPEADVKFFLTASPEERAKRRYNDLIAQGANVTYQQVLEELIKRDKQDQNRKIAPLVVPKGAIIIDTSSLDLREVLDLMLQKIHFYAKQRGISPLPASRDTLNF